MNTARPNDAAAQVDDSLRANRIGGDGPTAEIVKHAKSGNAK